MTRRPLTIVATALACLAAADIAVSQVRVGPFPPGQGIGSGGPRPIPRGPGGVIAIEPLDSVRPVIGAPYRAQAETQTTQVLADGNRIEQRTTATIARDSKGRIRREHPAVALGGVVADAPFITIADPAARTHVTLDGARRVAIRVTTPAVDAPRNRAGAEVDGRGPGPARAIGSAPRGDVDVKTEALGTRIIEGVRAEGTRTTTTIPAGAIGNQAPLTTVSERWYSPDLQIVVLTRRSDPRFGETVYRLVRLVRTEPSADLFAIPSDYRIEEPPPPPPLAPPE